MKVKIRNVVYSPIDEPIMIILTDDDKERISSMTQENHNYCEYPSNYNKDDILKWMKEIDSIN